MKVKEKGKSRTRSESSFGKDRSATYKLVDEGGENEERNARFTVKRWSTRSVVRSFTFRSRDPRIPNRRDVNVGHGCHWRDTRKLEEARAAKRHGLVSPFIGIFF